jgi:hypothetical protein
MQYFITNVTYVTVDMAYLAYCSDGSQLQVCFCKMHHGSAPA